MFLCMCVRAKTASNKSDVAGSWENCQGDGREVKRDVKTVWAVFVGGLLQSDDEELVRAPFSAEEML